MSNNDQTPSPSAEERALAMATDESSGSEGAVILRENARLTLEIANAKKQAIKVWSLVAILVGAQIFLLFVWLTMFPKVRYVETRGNEAVCTMTTADSPYLTPTTLAEFAKDAAISSYTYDYVNYERNVTDAANKFYTEDGRAAYLTTLDTSGNLEKVIKGRMVQRAYALKAPQLEEQGMRDPTTRYWVVTVPMSIEFYVGGSDTPRTKQDFISTVTLVSVKPSAANIKGVGVESMILKPYVVRR